MRLLMRTRRKFMKKNMTVLFIIILEVWKKKTQQQQAWLASKKGQEDVGWPLARHC